VVMYTGSANFAMWCSKFSFFCLTACWFYTLLFEKFVPEWWLFRTVYLNKLCVFGFPLLLSILVLSLGVQKSILRITFEQICKQVLF
jgi:hypothetical protein